MSFCLNWRKYPLIAVVSNPIDSYPTPINLNFMWSFGFLASPALVIQNITGVLLAMHYAPEIHLAFTSVKHIMRDVRRGVALRYIHANGASMFFKSVYILPIVPKPTSTYFESIGCWAAAHPIATTCIVVGSIGFGIAIWYVIAGAAGASGGAAGAALASEVVSNLPASSSVGSASQIAGTSLELLVPAVAQVVLAEPEIPRVLLGITGGLAGLALTWYTGIWSEDLTPLVDLTEEQMLVLEQHAAALLEENPAWLQEYMLSAESDAGMENLIRRVGERSGILNPNTPLRGQFMSRIVLSILDENPNMTFDEIAVLVENLPQNQDKHRVLLLFRLMRILIMRW